MAPDRADSIARVTERYRINAPPVALETVDEETIIVNLESGCYYDLNATGGHILALLVAGRPVEEITAAVALRWRVAEEDVASAVGRLVDELVAEQVVAVAGDGSEPAPPPSGDAPAGPYQVPRLGKYTDMQELLLLDPVHEVDASGWPGRA